MGYNTIEMRETTDSSDASDEAVAELPDADEPSPSTFTGSNLVVQYSSSDDPISDEVCFRST